METADIPLLAERFRSRGCENVAIAIERMRRLPINLHIPIRLKVSDGKRTHNLHDTFDCLEHILATSEGAGEKGAQRLAELNATFGTFLLILLPAPSSVTN